MRREPCGADGTRGGIGGGWRASLGGYGPEAYRADRHGVPGVKLALALIFMATAAQAEQCGPTEQVYAALSEKFNEARVSMGKSGTYIVEWWISPQGTFTALVTSPQGMSCIAAAGEDAEMIPQKPNL